MKVVQLDTVYGQGSTGKIVKDIHFNLLRNGHQSKVYYGRGPQSDDPGAVKISSDLEVFIDAGLSRLSGYTGVFSPLATRKLISDLEIFNPDVVHLHEVHGYYLNYFVLLEYLKKRSIPILWTLHCEYVYTGRCGYAFECDQWMTSCQKCPSINDYPRSLFFDRSAEQFKRKKELISDYSVVEFAAVSNWLYQRVRKSFLKDKPASIVHNGIDTSSTFVPRDYADLVQQYNLEGRYVVLSAAPDLMSSRKGGQWVLEAAKRLQDKPITFFMIGVLEQSLVCPPNVIFLPLVRDQEVLVKFYSLADLFLLTSQSETFSLTTAESLACGTPVVGFDSGGPSEVAPEPFGYFVPYGKIDALLSLIVGAYSGEVTLAKSDDCIDYARRSFSSDRMCQDYLDLYQKIAKY